MNNKFLILSEKYNIEFDCEGYHRLNLLNLGFLYYTGDIYNAKNISILIDGYVLPRNSVFEEYKHLSQFELIYRLYLQYGNNFVDYIKGFFLIVIIKDNKVVLVNDIHSVKRVFYKNDSADYVISNDVSLISKVVKVELNEYGPCMMALFQHFVDGHTMYANVFYSKPASLIQITNNKMLLNNYLPADYFAKLDRSKYTDKDFHLAFFKSINNYLRYLKPVSISTTLTGGRDTRSILSVLLNLNQKPRCFTFGYPTGIDVVTSKSIAEKCNLTFSNHYIEDLNSESYSDLVNKIIQNKNPFIHLHRSHRLDAIVKERNIIGKDKSMVFVGAMGGDYIKGGSFNDYILTEFLRRYLIGNENKEQLIKEVLEKHFIVYDNNHLSFIKNILESLKLEHNVFDKMTEFNLVHNIIGCTHDTQDISLFLENIQFVMAPFMDIDVMEVLFSTNFSLFQNTRHSFNPFQILKGGELQCSLIKKYSPELSSINFANQYTPNDVLGNRFKYVIKRLYLHTYKIKSKPTFSYDEWFISFVDKGLADLNEDLRNRYDFTNLRITFENDDYKTNEGYWHKFTNPIMIDLYNKILKS